MISSAKIFFGVVIGRPHSHTLHGNKKQHKEQGGKTKMLRTVSKDLSPFVAWVLERDGIPYTSREIEGIGQYTEFQTDISARRFRNVLEDAVCEKERRASPTPDIPVLSYRASLNPVRMRALLDYYHSDCFVIREQDQIRYYYTVRAI